MAVQSQTDPSQNISKILEIIDYKDDRGKFVKEFLSLCEKQALADLVKALPQEKQDLLNRELSGGADPQSVLNSYFTNEQKADAMKAASESVMTQYLDEVIPTLSENQLASLELFLSSIQHTAKLAQQV